MDKTNRGFSYSEFTDENDTTCILQESSLATCVWFGVTDAKPMCNGNPYPISNKVLIHNRMHLTQDHVEMLCEQFQKFLGGEKIERLDFQDRYGNFCSLEQDSDRIWLGIDEPNPLFVDTGEPYPLPDNVTMTTRMLLGKEQVANLLPILILFADKGELE